MAEKKILTSSQLLFSKDDKIVIKAINNLRKSGQDKDLTLLIELYSKNDSLEIKRLIYQFFCDLRSQSSTTSIIQILRSTTERNTLKMLVSSCWQTRLNYIDSFELFIDFIINNEFEISFEAFTLLESFEEKTTKARKKELISYVNKNIENCKEDNLVLASDLSQILENYKE